MQIPSWAKGSALSKALTKQYSTGHQLDPDTIFPEVFSCDLEAIFPVRVLPLVAWSRPCQLLFFFLVVVDFGLRRFSALGSEISLTFSPLMRCKHRFCNPQ